MAKKIEWTESMIKYLRENWEYYSYSQLSSKINKRFKVKTNPNLVRKAYERYKLNVLSVEVKKKPKVLLFDVETMPLEVYTWSIWQDSIPLNMVKKDWSMLSFAAKWLGSPEDEVFYYDIEGQKDIRNDKKIVKKLRDLLDEADWVVGHNSTSFDVKKFNARCILNDVKPPSSFRQFDTKRLAKKHFSFTSNKLEYLTDKLCVKYKKLKHGKFPGFSMWKECINGNPEAYKEMCEYNKYDVLSLEELFMKFLPYENANVFHLYTEGDKPKCSCGSTEFKKNGFYYTNACKYQRYSCKNCGAEYRDSENLAKKHYKMKGTKR